MTVRIAYLTLIFSFAVSSVWAVSINEIRIDQFNVDNDEYFELEGTAGEMLDDLTYLVLGDSAAMSGVIEAVISLDKRMVGEDGFFLVTEPSFGATGTVFENVSPDMIATLKFENSDNVTHVLVSGFSGIDGDDLDLDDDGTLDVTPWDSVIDAIGMVESPDLSNSGSEWYYGTALSGQDIGPQDGFVPAHVYRINNGGSPFVMGEYSLDPSDPDITIDDTPGSSNVGGTSTIDGDFDDNGLYECEDIDGLVAEIAAGTNSASYDMTGDGSVDVDDLTAWRVEAGSTGGLTSSGNPVLRGDANLDGDVNGQDFLIWNDNKFTDVPAWCAGDFNADGTVNGGDFLEWNISKFTSSDAMAVPETSPTLWIFAVVAWFIRLAKRKCVRGNNVYAG